MKHMIKTVHSDQKGIAVILLSAGTGDRISKKGTRSLYKIGDCRLIDHQVDTIKGKFPEADIITVLGFQADKVIRNRHSFCRVVENQRFQDTASGESLRLAVNNTCKNKIIVMHGDLYFDHTVFDCIDFNYSGVVTAKMDTKEVGLVSDTGVVTSFAYGLPIKWGQIAYFCGNELKILSELLNSSNCSKLWTHEILNKIVDNKGILQCYHTESQILEIDNPRDIE